MARRVIKIDGDAAGLKTEAQSATTTLKAELEAQKKAVAAAKAEARRASKAASDVESQEARLVAKVALDMEQQKLAAKKKALAEAMAAERTAAEQAKRLARETADAQRAAAAEARSRAIVSARQAGAMRGGAATDPVGSDGGGMRGLETALGPMASLAGVGALMKGMMQDLEAFRGALANLTIDINKRVGDRAESARLGGVPGDPKGFAVALSRAAGGRMSPAQIDAAVAELQTSGGGQAGAETLLAAFQSAEPDAAGSAMVIASQTGSAAGAAGAAGMFRQFTRGGSLTRAEAQSLPGLLKHFDGDMRKAMAYLAARRSTGAAVSTAMDPGLGDGQTPTASMPFAGSDGKLFDAYRGFVNSPTSSQSPASPVEQARNAAQNALDANIATEDQSQSVAYEMRKAAIEEARRKTATSGSWLDKWKWNLIDKTVGAEFAAENDSALEANAKWNPQNLIPRLFGIDLAPRLPNYTAPDKPQKVEVTNSPRAPMER